MRLINGKMSLQNCHMLFAILWIHQFLLALIWIWNNRAICTYYHFRFKISNCHIFSDWSTKQNGFVTFTYRIHFEIKNNNNALTYLQWTIISFIDSNTHVSYEENFYLNFYENGKCKCVNVHNNQRNSIK